MDETFKASNGLEFRDAGHRLEWRSRTYPDWNTVGAALADMPAGFAVDSAIGKGLAEFYQHRRDKELGRWRWPENPEYVVYPVAREHAVVLDERLRELWHVHLDINQAESVNRARAAFRAYLAAHSEPKPWDAAEEGDIWVLTGAGGMELPWRRTAEGTWESITPKTIRRRNEDCITAGRRIWPEGG